MPTSVPLKRANFASDNNAGMPPEILAAFQDAARADYAPAYGADEWTQGLERRIQEIFGADTRAFPVVNGTAANVLSISTLLKPWEAVVASTASHLENDECAALERFGGHKVHLLPTAEGRLTAEQIRSMTEYPGDQHKSQIRALTLTQSTECGTVYRPDELKAIVAAAHERGWFVHMDGSRISNAATFLKCGLREITADLGIDTLSLGGTKNGLPWGEVVVFFGRAAREASGSFPFVRKQGLNLASKMRFLSAPFLRLLEDDLWRRLASHANAQAARLAHGLRGLEDVEILFPVEANAVFVRWDRARHERVQKDYHFYTWKDGVRPSARLMTSFETTDAQVDSFVAAVKGAH